jgi:hypothetical protein
MLEFLGTVLEALAGKGGSAGIVQAMLERAAAMESSPDPAARKAGQELRARANALLKSMAPPQQLGSAPARAAAPSPQPRAPVRPAPSAAPARAAAPAARTGPPSVASVAPPQPARAVNPLLADLQGRSSLLRAIVTLEALGAPIALRDELGGPLAHR